MLLLLPVTKFERMWVQLEAGRHVVPTPLGIHVVKWFQEIDPSLCLLDIGSLIQKLIGFIADGEGGAAHVVDHFVHLFSSKFACNDDGRSMELMKTWNRVAGASMQQTENEMLKQKLALKEVMSKKVLANMKASYEDALAETKEMTKVPVMVHGVTQRRNLLDYSFFAVKSATRHLWKHLVKDGADGDAEGVACMDWIHQTIGEWKAAGRPYASYTRSEAGPMFTVQSKMKVSLTALQVLGTSFAQKRAHSKIIHLLLLTECGDSIENMEKRDDFVTKEEHTELYACMFGLTPAECVTSEDDHWTRGSRIWTDPNRTPGM